MLKVKLPDGTIFSMSIFVQGSSEEYLQHIIAVLCLINQKGLDKQCKEYNKEMKTASAALGALKQKSIGPAESSSKKDQVAQKNELEALKIENAQTQEMLKASTKRYNKAVVATFELLCNLLAGKPQTQWDRIGIEMHEHDSWAGPDGEKHEGKHSKGYFALLDCLELHKLMVFTADVAERQWYYIQQGI
jgi:hypothetical protein